MGHTPTHASCHASKKPRPSGADIAIRAERRRVADDLQRDQFCALLHRLLPPRSGSLDLKSDEPGRYAVLANVGDGGPYTCSVDGIHLADGGDVELFSPNASRLVLAWNGARVLPTLIKAAERAELILNGYNNKHPRDLMFAGICEAQQALAYALQEVDDCVNETFYQDHKELMDARDNWPEFSRLLSEGGDALRRYDPQHTRPLLPEPELR